jgi:hypothetical protein
VRISDFAISIKNDEEPTSFTYVGSYADSRMACQFIAWQLARGLENMKPSAGEA